MKTLYILLIVIVAVNFVSAQTTLKIYNDDPSNHSYTVTACEKNTTITLPHNRTTTTVVKGCKTAIILSPAGPIAVKDGDNVYIKDSKVQVVPNLWSKHIDYKN